MSKLLVYFTSVLLLLSCSALAQAPPPGRSPAPVAAPDQLTPQVLGEMLRSATTFHELVQNLNLNKSLGPDQHVMGSDGQLHHPMERTAATLGAGAGVGAAIGAMSHSQNGVLIGALVGSAGGLIIDQIVKHQEELRAKSVPSPVPDTSYAPNDRPNQLKRRDHDPN